MGIWEQTGAVRIKQPVSICREALGGYVGTDRGHQTGATCVSARNFSLICGNSGCQNGATYINLEGNFR